MSVLGEKTRVSTVETKATIVRGLWAVIVAGGFEEQVLERLTPATRALVHDLPPATMWLDTWHIIDLQDAVLQARGAAALRQLNRRAVDQTLGPLLRGAAERILRISGATPATLFSRMALLSASTVRGLEYRYLATSDTSCTLELEYPGMTDIPLGPFVATAGAFDSFFELCGARGTVAEPEILDNGRHNACRYTISWRARK